MEEPKKRSDIKVLMYHRVAKENSSLSDDENAVSASTFHNHIRLLDSLNFTTITFEDYQLFLEKKLSLPKKPIILTFDDGYRDTYEVARPILQEFDMRGVVYALGDRTIKHNQWDHDQPDENYALMSNEELIHMRAEGFEVGAHTMTHAALTDVTAKELQWEIAGSKEAIEQVLGEEVISFAYPYGLLNNQAYSEVLKAGFKFACGVYTGPPHFCDDKLNIRRLTISEKLGTIRFLLRILLPYEYLEWLYYRIRKKSVEDQSLELEQYIPKEDVEFLKDNTELS